MTQPRPNRQQKRQQQGSRTSGLLPPRMQANYIKSNLSRVVHVDGAYGGPTVHGMIYMALFSEHTALPESVRFNLDADNRTARAEGQPPKLPTWTREIEVECILNVNFAKSLRAWLDDKINVIESASGEPIQVIESQGASEQRP